MCCYRICIETISAPIRYRDGGATIKLVINYLPLYYVKSARTFCGETFAWASWAVAVCWSICSRVL